MIDYFIGVDGGGTGTRVQLPASGGAELAQAQAALRPFARHRQRLNAIADAITADCAGRRGPADEPRHRSASAWPACITNCGRPNLRRQSGLRGDAARERRLYHLMGAHCGEPGTIVAIGTGMAARPCCPADEQREVGGWGFPAGDEASGGWIGLRAINHIEQVLDGRKPSSVAQAATAACGGGRDGSRPGSAGPPRPATRNWRRS
jgi:glucosamine kinase